MQGSNVPRWRRRLTKTKWGPLMPKITKRTPNEKVHYADASRKDPGHDLNQPAKPKGKKKNTRRWCKGRVGQEHDYEITEHARLGRLFQYDTWTCSQCGKEWLRPASKALPAKEE